ncbi:translation elongation factor Ts [Holzapfeliella floricola]|uniref:Elongation factor Ts n=1 Tax=Holzapfeliella floricola DSM 23037 = JCM 16512 TaxID=1423744 RepID=A0A0R2DUD8_9LACO|nr:translation elongation factor Ts [Holzapfeliella floricola]KRN03805.1 elongation factor Ts [Holzapfeliella floricola DSM 23037 = JCM 16512]
MAGITAAQVKELREKTGAGMMDAKKALVATDGDMDLAIDELRKKGALKAAKKSDRVAAEGLADVEFSGNTAAMVEVNSETDFVSSNDRFVSFVKDVAGKIAEAQPESVEAAMALPYNENGTVQDEVTNLTSVIGEKISFRRFNLVKKEDNQVFGAYLHNGGTILALVTLEGADEQTAKDVAMHVAAINPKFVSRDDVPSEVLEHEKAAFTEETKNEGKPEKIIPKIVEGRMNKFLSEISLVDQEFVKDPDQTVQQFVESKGGKVINFVRYEVGEGIEKKADNFVEEVMSQVRK